MKTKKVNIYPRSPITAVNPPIRVPQTNVTKSIQDIRRCVIAGAKVEEVLSNGTVVLLNLNNYDRDNEPTSVVNDDKPIPQINYSAAKEATSKVEETAKADVDESKNEEPAVEAPTSVENVVVTDEEQSNIDALKDAVKVDDTVSVSEDAVVHEENKIEQHLTRRQRRALERMKAEQANSSSEEVVTNPVE